MIKFFQKIRQKLLSENRFNKYLLYAIGEIILVVIGILIALQINNQNESKNNKERFVKVLNEIRKDLKADLDNTVWVLNQGAEMDSLVDLVLDEKLTKEDYLNKDKRRFFWIALQYTPFDYQKTGFKKFENFQGIIPEEFDELSTNINNHYNTTAKFYDDMYNRLRTQIKDRHDHLSENYEWYHKLRKGEITEEMLDYYLNSPRYKNWVSQHKVDNTASKYGSVTRLEASAFSLLLAINNHLGDSLALNNTKLLKKYGAPSRGKEDWIGKYRDTTSNSDFSLYKNGGYLFINQVILKRINKDTLEYSSGKDWLITAKRTKTGEIQGINFIHRKDSTKNGYYKKIKQ